MNKSDIESMFAQQEKAKASLKESLAALTAAQKSLVNGAFKFSRKDD